MLKSELTPQQMLERLRWVEEWLDVPASWWRQVVFIDEFSVLEKPVPQTAIRHKGQEALRTDPRKKKMDRGYGSLALCLAVNAIVGLIGVQSQDKGFRDKPTC